MGCLVMGVTRVQFCWYLISVTLWQAEMAAYFLQACPQGRAERTAPVPCLPGHQGLCGWGRKALDEAVLPQLWSGGAKRQWPLPAILLRMPQGWWPGSAIIAGCEELCGGALRWRQPRFACTPVSLSQEGTRAAPVGACTLSLRAWSRWGGGEGRMAA